MTYGWAILLVITVAVAITSFGVLDQLQFVTGNNCKIYGGYSCADFKIDRSEQQIVLVVRNILGFDVENVTASIGSESCTESGTTSAAHASGDVIVSGSDIVITGGFQYGTTFTDSGSNNIFDPSPEQNTGESPEPFDIDDYKPGGSAALQAQAEGKYTHIIGDLDTSSLGSLDGLYYVTQDAKLSVSAISGTYTIVAEGKIDVSGSNQNGVNYIENLILFSNHVGDDAIKVGSSDNTFTGYFYAPNGEIENGGQGNTLTGGFLSSTVIVSGSELTITFVPIITSVEVINNLLPNPWINGQTATLTFNCSGSLQKKLDANIAIKWRIGEGTFHTATGIVKGKSE